MRTALPILLVSFLSNLVWEMSQAFLFAPHFSGPTDFIVIHVVAACIDIAITLCILLPELFLLDRIIPKKNDWRRFACTAILGLFVAVVLEKVALSVGIWSYGPYMPIIPFLGVGLTPVLQMMILPGIVIGIGTSAKSDRIGSE
ncbi:MAG TPA: hypothetical protein VN420_00680 [Candidatus Fimivivens sp.]|nr:hypothetical protein [Candidatus Fimivivens sp.]